MRGSKLKGILGICIMAISLAAMYLWMNYGNELLAKTVIVAKVNIEEGTIINDTNDFFTAIKMEDKYIIKNSFTQKELSAIKGKAANQFIPERSQVTHQFFNNPGLVISGDKFVFRIPSNWIYAIPSSIRAGDDISFYEVDSNIEKNISNSVTRNQDGAISTYEQSIRIGSGKPVLNSTVKYVKDSTNREVVDTQGPKRYDGTSQVSSLEIVCTEEEMKLLESKVVDGMKYIVVYR